MKLFLTRRNFKEDELCLSTKYLPEKYTLGLHMGDKYDD